MKKQALPLSVLLAALICSLLLFAQSVSGPSGISRFAVQAISGSSVFRMVSRTASARAAVRNVRSGVRRESGCHSGRTENLLLRR